MILRSLRQCWDAYRSTIVAFSLLTLFWAVVGILAYYIIKAMGLESIIMDWLQGRG